MKSWKIDVPVLIIFFCRPEIVRQVFDSVREARPSKLLLWQDGPRKGNEYDINGIQECKKIFEEIDWDCEIHRNYHDKNIGVDPSTFWAQKWAFSIVDKCIVLEDDMVPSQSFFPFMKELLDKYENDHRINHICGINFLGKYTKCESDYLFAYYGTGAWASWRRVAKTWESDYCFLKEPYYLDNLKRRLPILFPHQLQSAKRAQKSGIECWESILGFSCLLNNRLVIIPKVNMVSNVGVTVDGAHTTSLRMMPKHHQKMFYAPSYDIHFPLKHPKYVVPDYMYMDLMSKINGLGHPWLKRWWRFQYYIKLIMYGEFMRALHRRFNR